MQNMIQKINRGIKASEMLYQSILILFLVIFIPILVCIFGYGASMNYNSIGINETLLNNKVLTLFCAVFFAGIFAVFYLLRKIKLTPKLSIVLTLGLFVAFVGIYFINVEIVKCIPLQQGWDVECVNGSAIEMYHGIPIGSYSYMDIYSNNVPIAYFLYKLYDYAEGLSNFPYRSDFLWILVNCMTISITGFISCMTVKKVTRNLVSVLAAFLLYVACVGVTPWKTVAYTDMYALLFPALCVLIYVYYYDMNNTFLKYILWFLFLVSGFLGALIKPPVLVIVIAAVLMELFRVLGHFKKEWKALLMKVALIGLVFLLYSGYKNYVYEQCSYTYNEAAAVTYHHYLLMGINEESTGSYNSGVLAFHGQFATPEERIPAQMEEIARQLKERGVVGHLNFLLKKMVMTFNDGAFGWGREGTFTYYNYPIYSSASYSAFLRDIFWPSFKYCGRFNTYSQLIWLLIIYGVPGICFGKKDNRYILTTIVLSVLGIIAYLMLFESRARYLLCFLPVFIVAAAIGMTQYYAVFMNGINKLGAVIKNKRQG